MIAEFLSNCDYRKAHEFALYFGTSAILMTGFCLILLGIDKKFSGLPKTLLAVLSYAAVIGAFGFMLYLVDEQMLLPSACVNSCVGVTSLFLGFGGLILGFFANYAVFGKKLCAAGYY